MDGKELGTAAAAVALALGFVMSGASPARATLEMQKKAKAAGFAGSTNCLYCHNEKLPKKDAVTNNERGKWLVDQKRRRLQKDIDFAWLKEFVPPKK